MKSPRTPRKVFVPLGGQSRACEGSRLSESFKCRIKHGRNNDAGKLEGPAAYVEKKATQ